MVHRGKPPYQALTIAGRDGCLHSKPETLAVMRLAKGGVFAIRQSNSEKRVIQRFPKTMSLKVIVELFQQLDDLTGFLLHAFQGFLGHGGNIALPGQGVVRFQNGPETGDENPL